MRADYQDKASSASPSGWCRDSWLWMLQPNVEPASRQGHRNLSRRRSDGGYTITIGTQKNTESDGDGPFVNLTKSLRLFPKNLKHQLQAHDGFIELVVTKLRMRRTKI